VIHHDHEREELRLLKLIIELLEHIIDLLSHPKQATTAKLGVTMPLSVGGTTTATLTFVDASGNPAAPPTGDGSGLDVVFTSDNTAVATVGPATASGDTATATVTGVSAGTYNLSAVVSNTSGAALLDDDGTTAFVQPASVAESVSAPPPPQATTATITVA
jgi:hypothetical protein